MKVWRAIERGGAILVHALAIALLSGLSIGAVTYFVLWCAEWQWFKPVLSACCALFLGGLIFLVFDAIRTAYLGWKAGK